MSRRDQVLKRLRLERVEIPGEIAAKFEKVLDDRAMALYRYHIESYPPTLEYLPNAIKQLVRDVYLQGCMDGAQAAVRRPGLIQALQEIRDADTTAGT